MPINSLQRYNIDCNRVYIWQISTANNTDNIKNTLKNNTDVKVAYSGINLHSDI